MDSSFKDYPLIESAILSKRRLFENWKAFGSVQVPLFGCSCRCARDGHYLNRGYCGCYVDCGEIVRDVCSGFVQCVIDGVHHAPLQ